MSVHIQRWYDKDIELSEWVRTLEKLSPSSQSVLGGLMSSLCNGMIRNTKRTFLRQLSFAKLFNLSRSQAGKRWYDKNPELRKGFNQLYSLSEAERVLVARELNALTQTIFDYEQTCVHQNQAPDSEHILALIASDR